MGNKYQILARNWNDTGWNEYQTESLIKAMIHLVKLTMKYEFVTFESRK